MARVTTVLFAALVVCIAVSTASAMPLEAADQTADRLSRHRAGRVLKRLRAKARATARVHTGLPHHHADYDWAVCRSMMAYWAPGGGGHAFYTNPLNAAQAARINDWRTNGAPPGALAWPNPLQRYANRIYEDVRFMLLHGLNDCHIVLYDTMCKALKTHFTANANTRNHWTANVANDNVLLGAGTFGGGGGNAIHSFWPFWISNTQAASDARNFLSVAVPAHPHVLAAQNAVRRVLPFYRARTVAGRSDVCPDGMNRIVQWWREQAALAPLNSCTVGVEWELHNIAVLPAVKAAHTDEVHIAASPNGAFGIPNVEVRGDLGSRAVAGTPVGIVELVFGPLHTDLYHGSPLHGVAGASDTVRDAMHKVHTVVRNFRHAVVDESVHVGTIVIVPLLATCEQDPAQHRIAGTELGWGGMAAVGARFHAFNGAGGMAGVIGAQANWQLANFLNPLANVPGGLPGAGASWYAGDYFRAPYDAATAAQVPTTVICPISGTNPAATEFQLAPEREPVAVAGAVNEAAANQHIVDNTVAPVNLLNANNAGVPREVAMNFVQVNYILPLSSVGSVDWQHLQLSAHDPQHEHTRAAAPNPNSMHARVMHCARWAAVAYVSDHFLPSYGQHFNDEDRADILGLFTTFFLDWSYRGVEGYPVVAAVAQAHGKNFFAELIKTDVMEIVRALDPVPAEAVFQWFTDKGLATQNGYAATETSWTTGKSAGTKHSRVFMRLLRKCWLERSNHPDLQNWATIWKPAAVWAFTVPQSRQRKNLKLTDLGRHLQNFNAGHSDDQHPQQRITPAAKGPVQRVLHGGGPAIPNRPHGMLAVLVESRHNHNDLVHGWVTTAPVAAGAAAAAPVPAQADTWHQAMQPLCQQRRWDGQLAPGNGDDSYGRTGSIV